MSWRIKCLNQNPPRGDKVTRYQPYHMWHIHQHLGCLLDVNMGQYSVHGAHATSISPNKDGLQPPSSETLIHVKINPSGKGVFCALHLLFKHMSHHVPNAFHLLEKVDSPMFSNSSMDVIFNGFPHMNLGDL